MNTTTTTTTDNKPASPRQTFALFCATGKDWRPMNLTAAMAGSMLSSVKDLRGNKPAALAICTDIYGGKLPPPPSEIIIPTKTNNFAQIWDEAHEAGMEAYNAYNGGWYPCGFASILIRPGTSPFARWTRKNKGTRKSYYGGEEIWVGLGSQSMDQKAAYASAFAGVLQKHGIDARVKTAVD